ncbi:MAG TPA: tetratricopeptide repeat protein [Chitinophagaceae bacterium]|nr:tetratricopeptide repeat protein [Chitinophagaceae bacterium]
MRIFVIISILIFTGEFLLAQDLNKNIETGNNYYRQQQYDKAESEYRKVLETSSIDKTARFNLADALIKQNKADDANKLLRILNVEENGNDLRSKVVYNQAVILTQQKKLEESIEGYKEALRFNPGDQEARENLQKALLELKKKNPPKKQEEKKKQEQQKQQPKPKISPREAEQQLKLLEQKEKQVQERLQKNSRTGNAQPKDW